MNTNLTQEQVSALADGELDDFQLETALAALRHADGRAAWQTYHQIGDALRSDDTVLTMSSDFSQRLFARLDAEPTIIAPALAPAVQESVVSAPPIVLPSRRALKRFALPGMVAAAAVATVAFITTPQLMVASSGQGRAAMPVVAAGSQPVLANAALQSPALVPAAATTVAAGVGEPEEVILRDPRIDEYLFAHQRFSSSVYSTAQFARSSTFASNTGK